MAREIDWRGAPSVLDSPRPADLPTVGAASGQRPALVGDGISDAIADLVQAIQRSVVQIRVQDRGVGAGLIVGSGGVVVTNCHVVEHAEAPIVRLHAGQTFRAQTIRSSRDLDLALLQVPAEDLPAARLGSSGSLRVGQLVFAIGHPWGQREVVTAGIVSGIGRFAASWNGGELEHIRSDVELAPGNSGGPLLDAEGNVVGINSMILGGDLSAAIPSDLVQAWLLGLTEGADGRN